MTYPMTREQKFVRPRMNYIVDMTVYTSNGVYSEAFMVKAYDKEDAISLAKKEAKEKHNCIDFIHIHSAV